MRVRHGVIEALVASVRFMLCFVCNGCRCNKSFLLITLLVSGSDWSDHERLLNHERSSLLSCPLHKVMRLLSIGLRGNNDGALQEIEKVFQAIPGDWRV